MEKLKVTRRGYQILLEQRESLFEQLKKIQGGKGEAAEVGGNVWHDNFAFEELARQETVLNKRLADISEQINRLEVIDTPSSNEILQIGHLATLEYEDGSQKKIEIVGLGESDLNCIPQKIEYLAPIVRPFLGHEIDTTSNISIGGKKRDITLINIEMP